MSPPGDARHGYVPAEPTPVSRDKVDIDYATFALEGLSDVFVRPRYQFALAARLLEFVVARRVDFRLATLQPGQRRNVASALCNYLETVTYCATSR